MAARIGLLDQRAWLDHARTYLPRSAIEEWLDYHGTPNQPVIDLVRQACQAGCRLLVLANGTRRRHDDLAHHHLSDLAEHVYLSAEIGRLKPDPEAWRHVLHRSRIDPARAIAIDGHATCLNACRQVGLRAHHHTDIWWFRHALARAGTPLR